MANVSDEVLREGCILLFPTLLLLLAAFTFFVYALAVGVPALVWLWWGYVGVDLLYAAPIVVGFTGALLCRWEALRIHNYCTARLEADMADDE